MGLPPELVPRPAAADAPRLVVPLGRALGMGPFPGQKEFSCKCVMTMGVPDPVRKQVTFTVDYAACTAFHQPVPASADMRPRS